MPGKVQTEAGVQDSTPHWGGPSALLYRIVMAFHDETHRDKKRRRMNHQARTGKWGVTSSNRCQTDRTQNPTLNATSTNCPNQMKILCIQ
ncbi:hypothetical protein VTO42DRAFT_8142 [Malbranchea cinnamomea]